MRTILLLMLLPGALCGCAYAPVSSPQLDARTLCQQQAQASASEASDTQKGAYFDRCMIERSRCRHLTAGTRRRWHRSIRATLSALSMRAKCSAKIRSVHDRRNDLACRRGERLRFNRRRHAQRWATPILGAPTSRSSPASRRSPAARCSHAVRLIPSRFAAASIRARTCVSKRRLIVAKWPARELLARYSRLVSAQRHPLSHSVPQPGAL